MFSVCLVENVGRIFVDEAHELALEEKFRTKWPGIYELCTAQNWARIYLTATLPLIIEASWMQSAGLDPARTILIRQQTNRPELAYHVVRVDPNQHQIDSFVERLTRLVEARVPDPEGRRVIFTSSISACDRLQEGLKCFKHHSGMSRGAREDNLKAWRAGQCKDAARKETWIVATPGLITGYDYHRIDHVIFFELGYGIVSTVQGGGRAGRDGRTANVLLVLSKKVYLPKQVPEGDHQWLDYQHRRWAANTTECRRAIISDVMDGKLVTCVDLIGCNPCDICQPGSDFSHLIRTAMDTALNPIRAEMPTGDLQAHFAAPPNPKMVWNDDWEDMQFDADDLIRNVQLDSPMHQLPTPTPMSTTISPEERAVGNHSSLSPSGTVQSVPNRSSAPNQSSNSRTQKTTKPIQLSCPLGTSSVPEVGMDVRITAAKNIARRTAKQSKSDVLNDFASTLRGHCFVCWTCNGDLIPTTMHTPFLNCPQKLSSASSGRGELKKIITLEKWHFCYYCGLPQDVNRVKLRPPCHPEITGGKNPCPFDGLIFHTLFVLHEFPQLWKHVKTKLQLGDELNDLRNFGTYCSSYKKDTDNYWMGLEIVYWLWNQRKQGLVQL